MCDWTPIPCLAHFPITRPMAGLSVDDLSEFAVWYKGQVDALAAPKPRPGYAYPGGVAPAVAAVSEAAVPATEPSPPPGDAPSAADGVRVLPSGWVLGPASGRFDVTVSPGDSLADALDQCPPGGSILISPGAYEGPFTLAQHVHVFGRGLAVLWAVGDAAALTCTAAAATLDGLIVRQTRPPSDVVPPASTETANGHGHGSSVHSHHRGGGDAVSIEGPSSSGQGPSGLRLQACDLNAASGSALAVSRGADPVVVGCRCAYVAPPPPPTHTYLHIPHPRTFLLFVRFFAASLEEGFHGA